MISSLDQPRHLDLGLSWRAIFAGLVVGLVTQFILTLLGVAVGLSALDVAGAGQNARGVGVGAGLWALLVPIASWFLGAYVAAYASGVYDRGMGVVHGVTSWGMGLFLVIFLLTSGVTGAVSGLFGVAGTVARTAAQSGLVSPQQAQQAQQLAQQGAQGAQRQLGQVSEQDAQKAADAAAKGAWGTFALAVLSLGAAALGGALGAGRVHRFLQRPTGTRERLVTERERPTTTERFVAERRDRDDYPQTPIITPPRTT
jgi:hypothetical protein